MLAALIKKELLALTRDAHGLAALFLMPVMFMFFAKRPVVKDEEDEEDSSTAHHQEVSA